MTEHPAEQEHKAEQGRDISYICTDAELPPVAIIDRSPITIRHKVIFGIVAVVGAIAWAIIAFARGETVNAVWFVVAAICTYIIGFRFYARLIEMKIVRPRDDHATPAEVFDNGTDYLPTDRRVVFGHHFAAIAGAGPLVGPVLATALVAAVADPKSFRSGRNFSAWLGLVPKQHSSGGKNRLGNISKQGDRYLRSLFVAGALAVIRYAKIHGTKHRPWLTALLARRPTKVAAIALANKLARMVWAMMAKGERHKEPVALAA